MFLRPIPGRASTQGSHVKPFSNLLRILTLAAVAAPLAAQTTGVAGINDYTVNGSTPGSSSCPAVCIPTPGTITMTVNTVPGAFVIFVWTDCPCTGCAIPWAANVCTPSIPNGTSSACASTNQSLDFLPVPGCNILFTGTAFANAAGLASIVLTVGSLGNGTVPCGPFNRLSTQAVVFDPCGVGGIPLGAGPFVVTQAYDVGF